MTTAVPQPTGFEACPIWFDDGYEYWCMSRGSAAGSYSGEMPVRPYAAAAASDRCRAGHKASPTVPVSSERGLAGLLVSIAEGDRAAFTEYYLITRQRVFELAARLLDEPVAAEDVVQDVFLHVWTFADRFDRNVSRPNGWLMMITHRRCIDLLRSESAAGKRELDFGIKHRDRAYDVVVEAVVGLCDQRRIRECLSLLKPAHREAVILAFYEGYSYPQVADLLGCPLPTVKSRIRDGLRRLKRCSPARY
jgi:RNA polymerase sigma-70 factor, ECF subfamily